MNIIHNIHLMMDNIHMISVLIIIIMKRSMGAGPLVEWKGRIIKYIFIHMRICIMIM